VLVRVHFELPPVPLVPLLSNKLATQRHVYLPQNAVWFAVPIGDGADSGHNCTGMLESLGLSRIEEKEGEPQFRRALGRAVPSLHSLQPFLPVRGKYYPLV